MINKELPRSKPQTKAIFATFVVSACWHGFYPGYYFAGFGVCIQGFIWQKFERTLLHHQMKTGCNSVLFSVLMTLLTISQISLTLEYLYTKTLTRSLNFFWTISYQWIIIAVGGFVLFSILPKRPRTQVKDGKKEPTQGDQKAGQVANSIEKSK